MVFPNVNPIKSDNKSQKLLQTQKNLKDTRKPITLVVEDRCYIGISDYELHILLINLLIIGLKMSNNDKWTSQVTRVQSFDKANKHCILETVNSKCGVFKSITA